MPESVSLLLEPHAGDGEGADRAVLPRPPPPCHHAPPRVFFHGGGCRGRDWIHADEARAHGTVRRDGSKLVPRRGVHCPGVLAALRYVAWHLCYETA